MGEKKLIIISVYQISLPLLPSIFKKDGGACSFDFYLTVLPPFAWSLHATNIYMYNKYKNCTPTYCTDIRHLEILYVDPQNLKVMKCSRNTHMVEKYAFMKICNVRHLCFILHIQLFEFPWISHIWRKWELIFFMYKTYTVSYKKVQTIQMLHKSKKLMYIYPILPPCYIPICHLISSSSCWPDCYRTKICNVRN